MRGKTYKREHEESRRNSLLRLMLFDCWNRTRINGTCQTWDLKRFRFLARQESRGKKKEEMTQESRWPAAVSSWSLTEVLGRKTQEEWMTRAHEWTCKEGKESVKRGVLLALHPVISFSDDVSHFLFVQFLGHTPSSFLRTVLSKSSFLSSRFTSFEFVCFLLSSWTCSSRCTCTFTREWREKLLLFSVS